MSNLSAHFDVKSFMTVASFIDTNVLGYAASNAVDDQAKRAIARKVLQRPQIVFSAQVLQEFHSAAVTKQRLLMSHDEALAVIRSLARFPVCPITREIVIEAIGMRQRLTISYWDAAILVAAKQLECDKVYSEDLIHGQQYDGVEIVNPFISDIPA